MSSLNYQPLDGHCRLSEPSDQLVWSVRCRFQPSRLRLFRPCWQLAFVVLLGVWITLADSSAVMAQRRRPITTANFIIYAPDQAYGQRVAQEAERYRKELSIAWLGYEIGPWQERCPIHVRIGWDAGGETSFAFLVPPNKQRGYPTGWKMSVFGPPDRLLDAVLPHEITHTIFATHFGRPLPRWADEGACTTVEHHSERQKNHQMLMSFLSATPSRGIPFNKMFLLKDYPGDILPLYAQGHSVAKFLIMKHGRRHFLDFIDAGLKNEQPGLELAAWNQAVADSYQYRDLSELQIAWLAWVRNGSIENESLASNRSPVPLQQPATDNGNRVATGSSSRAAIGENPNATQFQRVTRPVKPAVQPPGKQPQVNQVAKNSVWSDTKNAKLTPRDESKSVASLPINTGWYAKQMEIRQSTRRVFRDPESESKQNKSLPPNPSKTVWR